ncbi:cation transport protein-domain-containing protein [Pyrenochaeta sp. MPI-SDFR-AT-0127]|nr:cation transport protein-domain-containing protein [Pyrenochaeta sp. MPI-SDFR-AT-0127]
MFGPWLSAFAWLKERSPKGFSALVPNLNFITLHYCYIISWTLAGSVILYGNGRMHYIDALFFASGSATQSGLNTIDVNKLALFQQVAIMLITCMCTPIFINTSVVFIRLYWFEKRFQNVVIESRSRSGRTRTMSKRKSEMNPELDRNLGQEERGVGDREIRVMRAPNGQAEGGNIEDEKAFQTGVSGAGVRKASSLDEEDLSPFDQPSTPVHQVTSNVVWADNLSTPVERERLRDSVESPVERFPKVDKEKSIAFVESQRNPTEKGKLRIPGPRDFDRGLIPEHVAEHDEHLNRITSRISQESYGRRERSNSVPAVLAAEDRNLRQHITIDVSARPRPTTGASVYNRAKTTDAETSTPTPGMHLRSRSKSRTLASFLTRNKEEDEDPMPYLSWAPTIGRNSNFVDLSEEQREELGGIEYRALKLLAMILVCYFVGFHALGMICLAPWINHDARYRAVVEAVDVNPTWWGFFTPASMFNDLGFTLTPDSMISFQYAVLPLVLGTFLIIIGNTGFPCMLRFMIWLISKVVPRNSGVWEELRFLLDHPRRCFTLLFPSKANWWLFWVLILLNGVDLIFFIILDLNDPTVTSLPGGFRFLAGLFQAAATRTAGFAVVNIADLHPAIQVSYLIMMYISIFPIAMSMRQTNVYEEKSLGVWADDDDDSHSSYLSHHLRRQLSFDLWFVFLGFFLIAIIEGARLENTNEYAFSLFSVLFEIVSAYGTVGLSLGFPGTNASFSGQFRTLSKLIIIAMQIRGRHRGLPYALDRAILLPSESLHQKENEDATRRARRGSTAIQDLGPEGLTRDNLTRTGTGLSRRSSMSGEQGRPTAADRFKPQQLKRILSGAFSAGPSAPMREKRA